MKALASAAIFATTFTSGIAHADQCRYSVEQMSEWLRSSEPNPLAVTPPADYADAADPDAAEVAYENRVNIAEKDVSCLQAPKPLLDAMTNLLERYRADGRKALQAEVACRADVKCMTEREIKATAETVCLALDNIDAARADIAREKTNPSGVVNLVRLHEDGETIQTQQDIVRESTAHYVVVAKKPFKRATACR